MPPGIGDQGSLGDADPPGDEGWRAPGGVVLLSVPRKSSIFPTRTGLGFKTCIESSFMTASVGTVGLSLSNPPCIYRY